MLVNTTYSEVLNIQFVDLLRDLLMKCLFYVLRILSLKNLHSNCYILTCQLSLWDLG